MPRSIQAWRGIKATVNTPASCDQAVRVDFKRRDRRAYAPVLQDLRVNFPDYADRLLSDDYFRLPAVYEAAALRGLQLVFDAEHPQQGVNDGGNVFIADRRIGDAGGEHGGAFRPIVKHSAFPEFKNPVGILHVQVLSKEVKERRQDAVPDGGICLAHVILYLYDLFAGKCLLLERRCVGEYRGHYLLEAHAYH